MWLCTIFVLMLHFANCARILVVLPSPILSHNVVYRTIYKELSLRGHEIVVFTPDPLRDNRLTKVKEIDMSYLYKEVDNASPAFHTGVDVVHGDIFLKISKEILSHPEMKKMVQHPKTNFDLLIVEWGVNPSLGILSKIFNCPMIGLSAIGLTIDGHDFIGNPTNPAYIPNGLSDFDGTFWSRMNNFLFGIMWRVHYHFYTIPSAQKIVNEVFPDYRVDVLDIQKNVSIIITNTHPVFTGVRPIVPANVEVGGVHLGKNVEPLSEELSNFLNAAKEGAVYVNLGSANTKIPKLTPTLVKIVTVALSQLPYKIIWRWDETDSIIFLNNVFISKWLPQEAILGHPNVKVFITNGGLQSFYEAVHKQVPVVGIPLFADQFINTRKIESLQIGKRIEINELDISTLVLTITHVAENPVYKKNIQKASELLHDLPMKPLDKAVWWIEYVLRHKGARHFRSEAIDMSWITYLLLDVVLFVIVCFFAALIAAYYLIVVIRVAIWSVKKSYSKAKTE